MCQSHTLNKKLACFAITSVMMWPGTTPALSLKQAEQLALESDPLVQSHQATSRSFTEESAADATLPDPKLRLGMFNVPVDSFSVTEDPATQLRVGIQQEFPRGNVLDLKQQQSVWLAQSSIAQADDVKLKILKDLRETYLNLYYEIEAGEIVRETRTLFSKLVKITEDQYAAGRVNQQDVIRSDLELSRLDDRMTKIQSNQDEYRAQLAQWIDETAWEPIDKNFPVLPSIPDNDDINQLMTQHPSIKSETAKVEASRKMIEMSRQDYKPGIGAFVEYRKRFGENPDGSDRSDMVAAMVTMDIPLFTGNRQDKNVAAREEKAKAARYARDDKLRSLKRMLEKDRAIYKRLGEREQIYRNSLLDNAKNNSEASLNAYQSGVTEFTTLMRARITELDVRLDDLRVRVDRSRARARLLYITGDPK